MIKNDVITMILKMKYDMSYALVLQIKYEFCFKK